MEEELIKSLKKKHHEEKKKPAPVSFLFTKILLCFILILSITIYCKLDDANKTYFKTTFMEKSLSFNKVNAWATKYLGKNILTNPVLDSEKTVFEEKPVMEYTPYLDGIKVPANEEEVILSKSSGIYVFLGEKEGYGNTLIIQGNNGIDIWYGNITNTSGSLYDYIEKGSVIGVSKGEYYTLAFMKDGKFVSYASIQDQI